MKTDFLNLKKSRWLLLSLLAIIVGASPAWADAKALPYSYGFEDYDLATDGWTKYFGTSLSSNNNECGIVGAAKKTGSYGFRFSSNNASGENAQYLISPELNASNGVIVTFAYKASSGMYSESFKVGYSTTNTDVSSFTWDEGTTSNTTSFKTYENTFPVGTKYVAIYYYSNFKSRLYVDDFSFTAPITGPAMAVADGSTTINSGYTYNFGLATPGTTHYFLLSNPGTEDLGVTVSETGDFGATLSTTTIPAGNTANVALTVTMPETTGSSKITITPASGSGIDPFVINVSGTIKDPSKLWCDFTSGLPTGWTNSGSWSIASSGADGTTSGGGYAYNTSYGSNKLMYTPLVTIAEGEKLYLQIKGYGSTASWNKLNIQYSADGKNWTNAKVLNSITNVWQSLEVTEIPAGNWYIGFYGSYVYFTDIYGGTESTAPIIALSQNSYDFGLIDANATSEAITISNTGKSALTGLNITSNNANFTVNCEATEIAANGGTATFTVTMAPNATGAQTATITVKSSNADDLVFTATGAVAKPGTTTAVFNDATLAGWTKAGNTSFDSDETAAYFYYSTNTLTSPKVNFAADDFLAVEAKMASSYGYVTVQGSSDGSSWTDIKKLDSSVLNTSGYTTAIVSGISTDYKYLRLNGYYCYVKQVAGLTYAPVLTVKKGDDVVTSPQAHAFGEIGADQMVTYNFNNTGAGTLYITNVESSNAVFTTNWTETIPASDYNLVITANYNAANAGEQNGTVTVTTTEGTFVINLTSTFLAANAPKFALLIGEAEQTTGADLGFGTITSDATKTFIIKNDGTGALNVTDISLPDADYSIDATAPFEVAAGASKTINVTLAASAKAIKTGNIVISATGFDDFSFKADAYVLAGTETATFESLPTNWTNTGWTISGGEATADTYVTPYPCLTTAKLVCEEGDFIVVTAKKYDNDAGDYIQIQYSTDNGLNWTDLQKLDDTTLPTNSKGYKDIVVSGIPVGTNRLRFQGFYARIKQIAGLIYSANDPKMGIYTDVDCTVAATTTETKEFGFATETQTATYYIKNVGTGTMTLALGDQPAGFTQALDKTSVAAGEKATLTITMPAETKGYRNGTVTVNATDLGAFTVAVSGIMVDENKLNLDFTTANIPSTWTNTNWTKNDGGFIRAPYSYSGNATLESVTLTAEADEEIVIVARSQSSSSSYTVGVNYKKADATEWSTLIAAANPGTTWTLLHAPIVEAGDYIFQFTGNYSDIQRIYGLTEPTEPVMVVYDGENVAANTYNFGNLPNDNDAEWTLTVKNEGKAVLAGLTATLSGEQASHYSVSITGLTDGNLAANASATITVKQLKDNLGAHAATLTISSTSDGISDFAIALSGKTRDASKMYVDFAEGVPTTWTATGGSWTTSSGYAQAPYSGNVTLTSPALSIAAGESLTVDLSKQYNNNYAVLTFRYTTDGGITWSEQDLSSDLTYGSFTTKTLSLGNEEPVTAFIQFVGTYYARIDNIYGGTPTTAPLFALATSETLTDGKYDFGQALQAAPAGKVFTITNNGNADLVSDIAANDDVEIALSGEDVTINGSQVTVPAGKTATLTVSLKFNAANPGAKTGSVTIDSNDPVADVVLNFIANVIDATAVNIDFASNAKPVGFYSNGWTYSSGYAANSYTTEAEFITSLLTVADPSDVLSYQARAAYNGNYGQALTVSYSTDRKNWTEIATLGESDLTATFQAFTVSGLKSGDYYLRFAGARVYVDNITGWHFATPVAEHDLYISTATFPTTALIPATENGLEASAIVNSLRADETGVTAKLFFGETEIATAAAQDITMDGNVTFNFTGNVPAEEGTYAAKAVAYYSDNSVAFETLTTNVEVAHTRTLSIADFARNGEGDIDADENNQFDAAFNVTVQNPGSTAATPVVKIFVGETEVGTATADAEVAAGESKVIAVSVADASAGEGGELQFTAKAYWTAGGEALATSASNIAITVNAAAPKFALYDSENAEITDGASYDLGIIKGFKSLNFTVKNEGNAPMLIKSITTPDGYTLPSTVQAFIANKMTIPATAGYNAIAVEVKLTATEGDYGKKVGDLVVTYKVDETTDKTFTLHLSGRTVAADTWVVDFEDGKIPADWDNSNSWTVSEVDGNHYATLTGWNAKSIMTPRLAAAANEELTFDVLSVGNSFTYAYSTNKTDWSEEVTVSSTGEQTFTAPAAGNYYLRFTTRNGRLDNLVGFKLNPLEHDTEIAASSVPTTGTQYADYTATVTLKENVGKAEEITATLYVDGLEKATKTETITANGSTVVTLTWEPDAVISTAVKAYIAVTGTGIDLTTAEVDLTIDAPYELDETVGDVANASYPALVLKHSFVAGWNTICLPFEINVTDIHASAKAFSFDAYNSETKELTFNVAAILEAGKPYVIYVPEAISTENPFIFKNVEIGFGYTTPGNSDHTMTFQGTYAPMAAGSLTSCCGLTASGKIAKAKSTTTMKGFRGYFKNVPSEARVVFNGFEDDDVTGIRMITIDNTAAEGTYNMQGQKVEQLKKGGLYIINGRKQVVK